MDDYEAGGIRMSFAIYKVTRARARFRQDWSKSFKMISEVLNMTFQFLCNNALSASLTEYKILNNLFKLLFLKGLYFYWQVV